MVKSKTLKFISLSIYLATMVNGTSALAAIGKVSRSCAPAGAQESITVDWTFTPHQFWTASSHYKDGAFLHTTNTVNNSGAIGGWENTWRSYAGHFASEFWYGAVIGYHYKRLGLVSFLGNTVATDCNLTQWGF